MLKDRGELLRDHSALLIDHGELLKEHKLKEIDYFYNEK